MYKEEKIAPFTEFYKQVVFAEKAFDVNYKEVAKVLFNEVDRLNNIIDKAIEYINENWGHWCSNHCKYATETIEILGGK